jgi:hypothetical protein
MLNLDDVKTGIATAAGIGNHLMTIDIALKVCISLVSLIYVVLMVREKLKEK